MLLKVGAVELNFDKPYIWASGIESPVYVDNRITLSYPMVRNFINEQLGILIKRNFPQVDTIAAVATGGIPYGAILADRMHLPLVYVRSSAKEHGKGSQIEGDLSKIGRTIVIEDTVSTGGSSLKAIQALKDAGINVVGLASIYSYQFKKALDSFDSIGLDFEHLCTLESIMTVAVMRYKITQEEADRLKVWAEKLGVVWGE